VPGTEWRVERRLATAARRELSGSLGDPLFLVRDRMPAAAAAASASPHAAVRRHRTQQWQHTRGSSVEPM